MANFNTQKELLFRQEMIDVDVSDDMLERIATFKESLNLCKQLSGLTDLQICQELGIDPGHFSRIWSNNAHFPDDLLIKFMTLCKNIIPVRWLNLQFGLEAKPLKSTLELALEKERAEKDDLVKKLSNLEEFFQKFGNNNGR